ncbi:DHA2 family efflux MFS transporter permease subunit [Sciscionella marina]|uniref:DHA2 family efflux MFS transporter permease subunit n=1 Tax=Sciscionella marina TaxID=508770 RepID=UPI00035FF3D0|nr:DHA2 family efflux MFS transporter permease subunit [Sciscionella marina]
MSAAPTDERAEPGGGTIPRHAWPSLIAVVTGIFVVMIDGTVVAVANPTIASDLHASPEGIQWVTNAYLLVLAGLTIPMGTLADKFGRKRLFLIGVGGFSLASLLCGLAGSIWLLVAARALQAVFGSMIGPAGIGVLRAAFPADKLSRALGIFGSISAIATAGGPIVGGLLVQYASWPWVFFINLPFGVLGVSLGLVIIRESSERIRQRLDLPGAITLTLAMASLVWGITRAQDSGWTSTTTLVFIALGLVLLAAFAVIELTVESPMVPLTLFRDRSLSIGIVLMIVVMFSMFSLMFFITFFLQGPQELTAVATGIALLPLSATSVVASPVSGWMTEKAGVRKTLVSGAVLLVIGLLLMQRIEAGSSVWELVPTFVIGGFGIGFMMVAATQAIVGNAPVDKAGVASGLQQSMTQLGGALGTSVLGGVMAAVVSSGFAGNLRGALGSEQAAEQVAAGLGKTVELGFPPAARDAIAAGLTQTGAPAAKADQIAGTISGIAHQTFMTGLHTVYWVGAAVAVLAGILALFVRDALSPAEVRD